MVIGMMRLSKYNLEDELQSMPEIIANISDDIFASELYAAFCNIIWVKKIDDTEERVIEILKGEYVSWSCSWRCAGGIISDLRDKVMNTKTDYMNWYCNGNEGTVSERVKEILALYHWYPEEWPD